MRRIWIIIQCTILCQLATCARFNISYEGMAINCAQCSMTPHVIPNCAPSIIRQRLENAKNTMRCWATHIERTSN